MHQTLENYFEIVLNVLNKYNTVPLSFTNMHEKEAALWLLQCPDEIKQINVLSCRHKAGLKFVKIYDLLCKYTHIESPYFTRFKYQIELLALEEKSGGGGRC